MSPRTLRSWLSIGPIVGTLVIVALLDWPGWSWYALPAVVAAVLLLAFLVPDLGARVLAAAQPEGYEDDFVPPSEPPFLETVVSDVQVHSAVDGYPFLFSAVVRWQANPARAATPRGDLPAMAVAALLSRAEQHTRSEHPDRGEFLGHWLAGVLGMPALDDSGTVVAYATQVRIDLRHADRTRLAELEELRKNRSLRDLRREEERERREYLGSEVLKSPGSAVVWWLSRHEEETERAMAMIGPLTCLSAVANDQEIPERYRGIVDPEPSSFASEPSGGFEHPEPPDGAAPRGGAADAGHERMASMLGEMEFPQGDDERAAFAYRLARMRRAPGGPETADHLLGRAAAGPPTGDHGATAAQPGSDGRPTAWGVPDEGARDEVGGTHPAEDRHTTHDTGARPSADLWFQNGQDRASE
ncbi:hypothetical protein ACWD6I_00200 [Streptomyces sp. NPDC002454]